MHGRLRRVQRPHETPRGLSSRSHFTLARLHEPHARFTFFWSSSHGMPRRTHRWHGRWSMHAVFAFWQFLHAWSFAAAAAAAASALPSGGGCGVLGLGSTKCGGAPGGSGAPADDERGATIGAIMLDVTYRLSAATAWPTTMLSSSSDAGVGVPSITPASAISIASRCCARVPTWPSACSFGTSTS